MANNTTTTDEGGFKRGDKVTTWTGEHGIVHYVTPGWVGVRIRGERVVHEWQTSQLTK